MPVAENCSDVPGQKRKTPTDVRHGYPATCVAFTMEVAAQLARKARCKFLGNPVIKSL